MKRIHFICLILPICLVLNVSSQDNNEEDEDEESEEETTTTKLSSKSEGVITTLNPLSSLLVNGLQGGNGTSNSNADMINAIVQEMLKKTKQGTEDNTTSTDKPVGDVGVETATNSTKEGLGGGGGESVNPALLAALLQMAVLNANQPQQQPQEVATTVSAVETDVAVTEQQGIEYIMGQVNKIIENVARGNISGIVESSIRIQAPASVQRIMVNVLTYLNSLTGGVFGLGTGSATPQPSGGTTSSATCAALPNTPRPSSANTVTATP